MNRPMTAPRASRTTSRAFTLIELLTVIAITAVLLTLIVVPVFQSFNLTRTAQAFADAQDKARLVSESIAREIGNSAGVRDLSGDVGWDRNGDGTPDRFVPKHTLMVTIPAVNADGTPNTSGVRYVQSFLPYSKLDLYLPAEGEENIDPSLQGYRNPNTGMIDPTMKAPKGSIRLSAAPGQVWVRYFVGLHYPFSSDGASARGYNDPYTGLLGVRNADRDNLYVLYRAEFVPKKGGSWNGSLFTLDANGLPTDLDDPSFFSFIPGVDTVGPSNLTLTARGLEKKKRIQNWLGIDDNGNRITGPDKASTTIVTEVSRYDMIQPLYDKASRKVQNDPIAGNNALGVPRLMSCVQFRPTRVSNDPAQPATALRLGEETLDASRLAADVYTTKFALWSNANVRVWPAEYNPTNAPGYLIARPYNNGGSGYGVFAVTQATESNGGMEIFDQTAYERALRFNFSAGVAAANPNLQRADVRAVFKPFFTDPNVGRVITSFNIAEVGNPNSPASASNLPLANAGDMKSPFVDTATNAPYSPYTSGTSFGNIGTWSVNGVFNRVFNELAPAPTDGGPRPPLPFDVHRFIDLRVIPNADGTPSPLFPNYLAGAVTGFTTTYTASDGSQRSRSRVSIVPGSEEIWGPDQLAGPNQGHYVRYTRVTTADAPGPNQYSINYTDLPEPDSYATAFPTVTIPNDLTQYDPTNLVLAVLQPRFKVGYLRLYSDPNYPIPSGTFKISYRFQFLSGPAVTVNQQNQRVNVPGDRLAVDYDTRQLMSVLLTIRNYPQSSVPNPQAVTLKATATVRNYVR